MGGLGSGNWYRLQQKKTTVEESLCLTIRDVRGRLFTGAAGTLSWTWASGNKCSIGYFVSWGDELTVRLRYRWQDADNVELPIRLQTTQTQFGGERWWFTCPLIIDGVACCRRAGKLYLPPGVKYFGCRACHGLTYRSCQEAHQAERQIAAMERIGKMESKLAAMVSRQR